MIAVVVARDSLYADRKEGEREKTREIMSEDEVQGGKFPGYSVKHMKFKAL